MIRARRISLSLRMWGSPTPEANPSWPSTVVLPLTIQTSSCCSPTLASRLARCFPRWERFRWLPPSSKRWAWTQTVWTASDSRALLYFPASISTPASNKLGTRKGADLLTGIRALFMPDFCLEFLLQLLASLRSTFAEQLVDRGYEVACCGRSWNAAGKNLLEGKIASVKCTRVFRVLVDHVAAQVKTGKKTLIAGIGQELRIGELCRRSLRITPDRSSRS